MTPSSKSYKSIYEIFVPICLLHLYILFITISTYFEIEYYLSFVSI